MLTAINGLPGSGKNVYATHLAQKHFRRTNSLLARIIRKINHEPIIINNVYSTYPILLKKYSKRSKKPPIYSNKVTLYDLNNEYSFIPGAFIVIDEVQAFYDSEEYKDFPREIAIFNQFHRHFDIDDIIYISQHPSRIVKKIRVLISEFVKIRIFFNIPLINIGFMYYTKYFEFEDYGKYHHPKKEAQTYDFQNGFCFFRTKKVFKGYESQYLSVLNENKPLYESGEYSDLHLSERDVKNIYRGLEPSAGGAGSSRTGRRGGR